MIESLVYRRALGQEGSDLGCGGALDLHDLVAAPLTLDDPYRRFRQAERPGEERGQLGVRRTRNGWRGEADLKHLAVGSGDLSPRRTWLHAYLEAHTVISGLYPDHGADPYETRRVLRRRKSIMMYWPSVTVEVK